MDWVTSFFLIAGYDAEKCPAVLLECNFRLEMSSTSTVFHQHKFHARDSEDTNTFSGPELDASKVRLLASRTIVPLLLLRSGYQISRSESSYGHLDLVDWPYRKK